MNKKHENILRHGLRLIRIFPHTGYHSSPFALYRTLHRVEAEAHRLAEAECNEQLRDGYVEEKTASIMCWLENILLFSKSGIPVFVNHNPRGYALKIDSEYVKAHDLEIERDWGGYGILAPEF